MRLWLSSLLTWARNFSLSCLNFSSKDMGCLDLGGLPGVLSRHSTKSAGTNVHFLLPLTVPLAGAASPDTRSASTSLRTASLSKLSDLSWDIVTDNGGSLDDVPLPTSASSVAGGAAALVECLDAACRTGVKDAMHIKFTGECGGVASGLAGWLTCRSPSGLAGRSYDSSLAVKLDWMLIRFRKSVELDRRDSCGVDLAVDCLLPNLLRATGGSDVSVVKLRCSLTLFEVPPREGCRRLGGRPRSTAASCSSRLSASFRLRSVAISTKNFCSSGKRESSMLKTG